jgi:DNA repair protein SbcC/Rad50
MEIKRIVLENLRSYRYQEIIFPKGSTLLSGDIGSGKTTILLAIEFALFGIEPGKKGSSLLRSGEDNGKVTLEFELDGENIIIQRSLKRSKRSVSQEDASVTINNNRFEGSVTEIKNKVLTLLNYPSEFAKKTNLLYKFTVYTPQEEMKQIILEPGDIRLNTLRHVFGIDKYKRIEENTNILSSKLRERIRINEGIIFDLDKNKDDLNKKKDEIVVSKEKQKKASEEYKKIVLLRLDKEQGLSEIVEKIEEKKNLSNELEKSEMLIHEKREQTKTLQSVINSLKIQVEESKKLSINEEEYKTINQRIEFQQSKLEETQKEYIVIISEINTEMSKVRESENLKNKISGLNKCPTCLQDVTEEYKKNIFVKTNQELYNFQKRLSELNAKKNSLIKDLESIKIQIDEFRKKKSEMDLLKIKLENIIEKENRIKDTEKQRLLLEKDIEMLEKHTKTIEKAIEDLSQFDRIYQEKNKEIIEAKKLENNSLIQQTEINKDIQFLEKDIKEMMEIINKKQELKSKNEKIRELEYWVSEKFVNLVLFTEKQVMLTLKDEFSKLFSKWFSMLVSENLSAKLSDDFSPIIEVDDYELDYEFLSGGERTAIALAYRLALNQVINSLLSNIKTRNLVILDEPTDGFSSSQLDRMKDVFDQLNFDQLILVSHEQRVEDFVNNIIRMSKDNGITSIL